MFLMIRGWGLICTWCDGTWETLPRSDRFLMGRLLSTDMKELWQYPWNTNPGAVIRPPLYSKLSNRLRSYNQIAGQRRTTCVQFLIRHSFMVSRYISSEISWNTVVVTYRFHPSKLWDQVQALFRAILNHARPMLGAEVNNGSLDCINSTFSIMHRKATNTHHALSSWSYLTRHLGSCRKIDTLWQV
jgi:hypothetical protein